MTYERCLNLLRAATARVEEQIKQDQARIEKSAEIRRLREIERAACSLYSRFREGPGEDASIFAEWDDLGDALEVKGKD